MINNWGNLESEQKNKNIACIAGFGTRLALEFSHHKKNPFFLQLCLFLSFLDLNLSEVNDTLQP